MLLKLVVISPEKKLLETECQSVTLPTQSGEITVLPKHMAIFSLLKPGELIVRTSDGEISFAVGGGFVNITSSQVTVLPEFGVRSEEIDEEQVKAAKLRAEQILQAKTDEISSALAHASLSRSLLELKVAKRRHRSN